LIKTLPSIGFAKTIIHSSPHSGKQDAIVDHYVSESGGVIISVPLKDFGKGLEQLLGLVWSQYSIGWKPPDSGSAGEFHRIRIEVKGRSSIKVRTKTGYYLTNAKTE
jgi:hypothetical protein